MPDVPIHVAHVFQRESSEKNGEFQLRDPGPASYNSFVANFDAPDYRSIAKQRFPGLFEVKNNLVEIGWNWLKNKGKISQNLSNPSCDWFAFQFLVQNHHLHLKLCDLFASFFQVPIQAVFNASGPWNNGSPGGNFQKQG